MDEFQKLLHHNGYRKIPFIVTKTQHLHIKAKLNGVAGNFILDTGASSSCVGFEGIEKFNLKVQDSETKAAGAGAVGMTTQLAEFNELKVSRWKRTGIPIVVFDMTHVNLALTQHKAKPVDGILGADILLEGKGIIDYYNHCLYLT